MKQKSSFSNFVRRFILSEAFKYLFFGVLATLFYMVVRALIFALVKDATLSAMIANVLAILFAFFTNDRFVFNQKRQGWFKRLVQFFVARLGTLALDMVMAWYLVDTNPHLIGQFVGDSKTLVNTIEMIFAQVLIIALNYLISKFFVFKDKKID
ncbi:GtrA family protein [Streptococcus sp. DD12]|uniref:GtrA family protein n=1 Tax=Streptococcus sp. DD12 TaxID=1777880 RepID=UPI00079B01E4|nr:GtrA family protein [Streptococcus sp. DD12]KXT76273.1 GtrA family protein [Streptococcus sp. DD12]